MGNVNFDELVSQSQSSVKVNGINTGDGDTPAMNGGGDIRRCLSPPLV